MSQVNYLCPSNEMEELNLICRDVTGDWVLQFWILRFTILLRKYYTSLHTWQVHANIKST